MVALSEVASSPEEQLALDSLHDRLKNYRQTTLGKIFLQRADRDRNNSSIAIGERLIEFGLYLVHCSIQSNDGLVPYSKIGNTYLISDYTDMDFVHKVDASLLESQKIVEKKGATVLQSASQIHDHWFNQNYQLPFDDEAKKIMFDLPPVVVVWDHRLPERKVFGDLWGIPPSTDAPVYAYLKRKSFPPAFFVGSDEANDSKKYFYGLAKEQNMPIDTILALSDAHERVHRIITNPVSELCLPSIYHWWGEALAYTYANIVFFENRAPSFYSEATSNSGEAILKSQDGKIDYVGSAAMWLALCSIKAESTNPVDVYKASDELTAKMCRFAYEERRIAPGEIPHLLIPNISEYELLVTVNQQKSEILKMLAQGKF